ncbi:hypothetical protein CHH80_13650 [Bacillus sp. 7504-2]|nr:hypothetical protein CHH80_13650 [Bacillus sp. 7504-2]
MATQSLLTNTPMVCVWGNKGKGGKKKAYQIALGYFHFKPLASSVCQEFAPPIAEQLKNSRALLNKK